MLEFIRSPKGTDMTYKHKVHTKHRKKLPLIITLVLLFPLAVVFILELTNTTNLFMKENVPRTSSQYTKGEGQSKSGGQTTNNSGDLNRGDNTPKDTKGQSDTPITPEANLIAPTGNFVSTHRISLDSNPQIGSTCETTPKATCQITFAKDGKTIELNKQTTDDGGATYWVWKPKDIGLDIGTWKVQAKAQLGSQSLEASDALTLEITQ